MKQFSLSKSKITRGRKITKIANFNKDTNEQQKTHSGGVDCELVTKHWLHQVPVMTVVSLLLQTIMPYCQSYGCDIVSLKYCDVTQLLLKFRLPT